MCVWWTQSSQAKKPGRRFSIDIATYVYILANLREDLRWGSGEVDGVEESTGMTCVVWCVEGSNGSSNRNRNPNKKQTNRGAALSAGAVS